MLVYAEDLPTLAVDSNLPSLKLKNEQFHPKALVSLCLVHIGLYKDPGFFSQPS